MDSVGHHHLHAARTPGNTAPLLHSSLFTHPWAALIIMVPLSLHTDHHTSPGCIPALQEAPFCDQLPNQSRAPSPPLGSGTLGPGSLMFLVSLQPLDKYTVQAACNQSLRLTATRLLMMTPVYLCFLKPGFNPFIYVVLTGFHSNFCPIHETLSLTQVICVLHQRHHLHLLHLKTYLKGRGS